MSVENWVKNHLTRSYQGKNIMISGGTSGIGLEASRLFLQKGANLILAVRNLEKASFVAEELRKEFPNQAITLFSLDLASFSSIFSFVEELKQKQIDVDVLIHNAGVFNLERSQTKDGLEIVMGTNYFGTRYLNDLFFEYAKRFKHPVEIILSSSLASRFSKVDFKDFFFEKSYPKFKVYGRSKRLIIHYYLACLEQAKESNVIFYLTHPGATYTPLMEKAYSSTFLFFARPFMKLFFHSPKKAALSYLYALERQNSGFYYYPRGLFHFSGYPKKGKICCSLKKNYQQSQQFCQKIIEDIQQRIKF